MRSNLFPTIALLWRCTIAQTTTGDVLDALTTGTNLASTLNTSIFPSSPAPTISVSSVDFTSALRPTATDNAPNTSLVGGTDGDDNDGYDEHRSGLLNYYFVFLGLIIVAVFISIYWIRKQRRIRKEAFHRFGQNELERDVNSWEGRRMWIGGQWRSESRNDNNEGLNELGQAPPPYVAKEESSGQVQYPLRTLARDGREHDGTKLPGYSEAARQDSAAGGSSRLVRGSTP